MTRAKLSIENVITSFRLLCHPGHNLMWDLMWHANCDKLYASLSYGPPWAHYLGGYQDRLLGGPLGLPGLSYTTPDGVEHKDYGGEVLG
jgi:hypothetical protein